MHGAGGGPPTGVRNGNYRHGARTKAFEAELLKAKVARVLAAEGLKSLNNGEVSDEKDCSCLDTFKPQRQIT